MGRIRDHHLRQYYFRLMKQRPIGYANVNGQEIRGFAMDLTLT